MKKCPKGHSYPKSLKECPVCAKDNELKTVFSESAPELGIREQPDPSDSYFPSITQTERTESVDKTVVLERFRPQGNFFITGWLVVLDSEDVPINSHQLFNREMTIGRNKNNDIALSDNSVSGTHCVIRFQDGNFVIYDNNSSNGTLVDDRIVQSQVLDENSIVCLGQSRFKIKYL